jgi:hypothetical protein
MLRLAFVLLTLVLPPLFAQQSEEAGPLISITSPDTGTTFAFGSIKSRALIWNKKEKMLSAQVTFVDSEDGQLRNEEDTHSFRLPGVTFDEARGLFLATSPRGELIPVARVKKELFFFTIQMLPNAVVRVQHPRGNLTVVLEAIRPDDPALRSSGAGDSNGTHPVDIQQSMQ